MIHSFLLIGQSNMAGRGEMDSISPIINDKVKMLRNNEWVIAREPVHQDKEEFAGVGLCMSFADYLSKKYDMEIGLIPCAMGGTSLDQWAPGGKLYEDAVRATLLASRTSQLSGILWHQGEADSKEIERASTYQDRWIKTFDSLIADIGYQKGALPIMVGELGEFLKGRGTQTNFEVVNENLKALAREHENIAFVSASGLTDIGDQLHFNSQSLREFGIRYAKAWEELRR